MRKKSKSKYLFRGSTISWAGNPINRKLPRTSVTTNPIKAILFALCCSDRNAVIYFNHTDNLKGIAIDKNVLAIVEEELAFEIAPADYAILCDGYLYLSDAINIINGLGLSIPPLFDKTLFDFALKETATLNDDVIEKIYIAAKPLLKKH